MHPLAPCFHRPLRPDMPALDTNTPSQAFLPIKYTSPPPPGSEQAQALACQQLPVLGWPPGALRELLVALHRLGCDSKRGVAEEDITITSSSPTMPSSPQVSSRGRERQGGCFSTANAHTFAGSRRAHRQGGMQACVVVCANSWVCVVRASFRPCCGPNPREGRA
jgi:hypothetical protein